MTYQVYINRKYWKAFLSFTFLNDFGMKDHTINNSSRFSCQIFFPIYGFMSALTYTNCFRIRVYTHFQDTCIHWLVCLNDILAPPSLRAQGQNITFFFYRKFTSLVIDALFGLLGGQEWFLLKELLNKWYSTSLLFKNNGPRFYEFHNFDWRALVLIITINQLDF